MTDREIAEKKKELRALMEKLEMGGSWWPQGFVVYSDDIDEVWQWIEELIKEVEKRKILEEFDEGFVDESDVWKTKKEWEMEEDKGFLFKDNKLIPIKKGFKLKVGKDQRVTKFKLGKDN